MREYPRWNIHRSIDRALATSRVRADVRVVIVRAPGGFVPSVDPRTRKATDTPQQFRMSPTGALTILPRSKWVSEPETVNVETFSYR